MPIKIRRNDPCPCGSGFKYKHCCGAPSPSLRRSLADRSFDELPAGVQKKIIELQQAAVEQRAAYGYARRMVTVEMNGYRLIATHDRIEWSDKWKTPIDFFGHYIKKRLNGGWGNTEIATPYKERHPILQWYQDLCEWQRRYEPGPDGIFGGVPTGSVKAYYALAYDLWTLDNYALLQDKLIKRLKIKDQFQGARYEVYVAAALVRAGFEVALEDEGDPTRSHCEFVATHERTGQKFSVEAKSTARPGMLGKAGIPPDREDIRGNVYRKLQDALLKYADHERIIFVDVNAPPHDGISLKAPWLDEAIGQLKRLEENQSATNPYPPAYLFFTNHPYHYVGNDDVEPSQTAIFTAINIPDFKQETLDPTEVQTRSTEHLVARPPIDQLVDSVFNHTRVPTRF